MTLGANKTIHPLLLDINPGETVTWTWIGPDTNHSTTAPIDDLPPGAVTWDSDLGEPTGSIDHTVGETFAKQFAVGGSYFYGCRVHTEMRATVRATGLPTARVTASPTNPLTDQEVTFNAGNSFDGTSGTIVNYEWDIDGNTSNGFELDTGGVPTATRSYAAPSPPGIVGQVRVTDADGATATAAAPTVTVRSRVPVASFNVSAAPLEGQAVTFTSNSTDAENDITVQEWDLDNDGIFSEADEPDGATAQRAYPVGPRTVGLHVVDSAGRESSTTRSFTVQNQLPSASFTATPGTVLIGETVSFDGTASSDVLGGITTYAWDLDGDPATGVQGFEQSGASPTTSTSYGSAGSRTVRLRVTDDDGGTNTTTRTVTVNAPPGSPAPPPPAPAPALPAPSPAGDPAPVLPPAVTVAGPARQRALRQRGILVTGGCDRACALVVRGSVNVPGASRIFRLRQVTRSLAAAGSVRVKLALPRAAQAAIRSALRRRKRVTATITVAATDSAGTSTRTRRIVLIG